MENKGKLILYDNTIIKVNNFNVRKTKRSKQYSTIFIYAMCLGKCELLSSLFLIIIFSKFVTAMFFEPIPISLIFTQ